MAGQVRWCEIGGSIVLYWQWTEPKLTTSTSISVCVGPTFSASVALLLGDCEASNAIRKPSCAAMMAAASSAHPATDTGSNPASLGPSL